MIDNDTRAAFAAIALAHHGDRAVNGLFDHSLRRPLNITAVFNGTMLSAVDLDRKSRMVGHLPDFYDEVRRSYIHLTPEPERYVGYDHKTGTHVHLTITGETANLYDYGAEAWFQYSLKAPTLADGVLG